MMLGSILRGCQIVAMFFAMTVAACGINQQVQGQDRLEFHNELSIPQLLEPTEQNGRLVFDLTLQAGDAVSQGGKSTVTWGANGANLMPTIRMRRNAEVEVRVGNTLDEQTTMHWHGMHLPARMDGVYQLIEAGSTWRANWTVKQQAATLWYHPHKMGRTGHHVYNGLAGLILIEDENTDRLDLPRNYGVDDIPLIVQDREFNESGQAVYRAGDQDIYGHTGMLGDTVLVNGTHMPYVEVPGALIRLRVLNASNARRYHFAFSDGRVFHQIASDGGFLEKPVVRESMTLVPGERAEIIVDMSDRNPTSLLSHPIPTNKGGFRLFVERILGATRDQNDAFRVLEIRPQPTDIATENLPSQLNSIQRWRESDAVETRRFILGDNTINGLKMDPDRIDFEVLEGTREIWVVSNPSASHHPFHVHGAQFQILDRNGELPFEHERGWKDTVSVDEDETVRLILEFKDYADPDTPFMFHCHILEHEGGGMMGQFLVVPATE